MTVRHQRDPLDYLVVLTHKLDVLHQPTEVFPDGKLLDLDH